MSTQKSLACAVWWIRSGTLATEFAVSNPPASEKSFSDGLEVFPNGKTLSSQGTASVRLVGVFGRTL